MDGSYNVYCRKSTNTDIYYINTSILYHLLKEVYQYLWYELVYMLHEMILNLPQRLPQDKQDFLGKDLRWGLGSWADILDWPTSLKRASTRKIFK